MLNCDAKLAKLFETTKYFNKKLHFSCIFEKKSLTLHRFLGINSYKVEETQTYKPSPVNHAMLFGIELGIWFGLNFIISAMAQGRMWMGVLSWLVTFYILYGVYRSALHYKHTECEDKIRFGQSLSYIVWLFFFASIVGALVKVIYLKWINPDVLTLFYEQSVQSIRLFQLSDVEAELVESSLQTIMQPVRFCLYYIMYDLIMGLFVGLILSPFVCKNRKS